MKGPLTLSLLVAFGACGETPTDVPASGFTDPSFSVVGADNPEGAIVLNRGEASDDFVGTCTFLGRVTTDVMLVRLPHGGGLLSCQWDVWPTTSVFDRAQVGTGFNCFLNFEGYFGTTQRSQFVLAQNGTANMNCTFREMPDPPTAECFGLITSGIASTWPWAHGEGDDFPPPPGSLAQWIQDFGPLIGIETVRDLQLLFCGQ
jgi:hypothetical protein